MNMKLDTAGNLSVNGVAKFCPRTTYSTENKGPAVEQCGEWCALFEIGIFPESVRIDLCSKRFCCEKRDFTDERIH